MKSDNCKEILLSHLKHAPGWHKKGSLYCVAEESGYSPETGSRKLRELAEEGIIKVDYYKGQRKQKLARYSYDTPVEKKLKIIVENGKVFKTYV